MKNSDDFWILRDAFERAVCDPVVVCLNDTTEPGAYCFIVRSIVVLLFIFLVCFCIDQAVGELKGLFGRKHR